MFFCGGGSMFFVYILASRRNGTLYVGVTRDIVRRTWEHREGIIGGFTRKYRVKRLVWLRQYDDPREAIAFEKRLTRWRRAWKLELIEETNPEWDDLYLQLF